MTKAEMFQKFISNLAVSNADQISLRYEEVTSCLNKKFRDTDSKTANSLQVGSYGRWTAIDGVSDLDMLYIMPKGKWDDYKDGKQSKLLNDTKDAFSERYPRTEVKVDRLVVQAQYTNFKLEIQPVFEEDDGSFKYPDTYDGGAWKITKPRDEIKAMKEFVEEKNNSLRHLCKMARAWKNKHGVGIGGLLIDTLAYNFLKSTSEYDKKSFLYYGEMSRDFFRYLADQPSQDYYAALGSGQRVKVKQKFQSSAKEAYELCLKAIEAAETDSAHDKWKQVYGRPFPAAAVVVAEDSRVTKAAAYWDDTEQFVEDMYPVDIRGSLNIECDVKQNGFREHGLREMLARRIPLLKSKSLNFHVVSCGVEKPYQIKWKILNRGYEAQKRNCIRGQIVDDGGHECRVETTTFHGEHVVECYVLKSGVIVARDRIDVPIS